jgi:predicted rRNA methylase YqxC with S4 and FtsJ domains
MFTRNNLIQLIKIKNPIIAEIGVEYGGFTDIYYNDNIKELHLIDMWQTEGNDYYFSQRHGQVESGYEQVKFKYSNKQNIRLVKMKSSDASILYPSEYFDWIYIDADHSYSSVLEDIKNWYPKLKKNGVISGHDFDPDITDDNYSNYGVKKAVEEFFGKDNFKLTEESNYKSWYVIK